MVDLVPTACSSDQPFVPMTEVAYVFKFEKSSPKKASKRQWKLVGEIQKNQIYDALSALSALSNPVGWSCPRGCALDRGIELGDLRHCETGSRSNERKGTTKAFCDFQKDQTYRVGFLRFAVIFGFNNIPYIISKRF